MGVGYSLAEGYGGVSHSLHVGLGAPLGRQWPFYIIVIFICYLSVRQSCTTSDNSESLLIGMIEVCKMSYEKVLCGLLYISRGDISTIFITSLVRCLNMHF